MNKLLLSNFSFLKILFILLFFLDLFRIIFNVNAFYLYFSLLFISSIIIIKYSRSFFVFFKNFKNSSLISDYVMENGILLGCHHGMKLDDLKYICKVFINFLKYKKAIKD